MKNKSLWVVLGIVAVVLIWGVSSYNGMVEKDESVSASWANVESVYQRRADLIPSLVNTVKGYAKHENETLMEVAEARSKSTSINIDPATATPAQMEAWMRAQDEVSSALGRLIAISENYPDLKASENFKDLQMQLEGTENRIATERMKYNDKVRDYNAKLRSFPTNIIAGMFGFEKRVMFDANEGAEVAPVVEF